VAVLGTTVPRASNSKCVVGYDRLKRCICPLFKFVYSFKVIKHFLKHSVCVE
jgi:hypothetical protein